jgi:UDP-N-acetyl-D-mannosaminuronic acid dehydrogenase
LVSDGRYEAGGRAANAEVVVVGCGAIGLALALAFASRRRRALGIDIDADRIAALNAGRHGLVEADFDAPFQAALAEGRLRFAVGIGPADEPRAYVIAAPTPASADGFDSGPLERALASIAAVARPGELVCIRSTAPIGTTRALAARAPQLAFAACPDRSIAGRAYPEQFEVPHLVGGLDAAAGTRAEALFATLGPVARTPDPETAEAVKLFANVERDVSFALANQFALICEAAGVDFAAVRAAGAEGFARFRLARAGPVGGPCLTKDTHVLAASAALSGQSLGLLEAARRLNDSLVARLAAEILAGSDGPVAILGLAFKGAPETADVRGGFGGALAAALAAARPGRAVRTWDPVLAPGRQARAAALKDAAVVVLANDHPALARLDDLPGLVAPGAEIHDMTGVTAEQATPAGLTLRRFGGGSQRR